MAATILIVDDEELIRALLTAFLKRAGYQTHTAASGNEALVQLQEQRPDLVITDIQMPGMNGYEFCQRVRGACDAPIIVLTGSAGLEENTHQLHLVADAYLTKPLRMQELLDRVAALIGSRTIQ
jgi:DNA-binding response OmpR family regulator